MGSRRNPNKEGRFSARHELRDRKFGRDPSTPSVQMEELLSKAERRSKRVIKKTSYNKVKEKLGGTNLRFLHSVGFIKSEILEVSNSLKYIGNQELIEEDGQWYRLNTHSIYYRLSIQNDNIFNKPTPIPITLSSKKRKRIMDSRSNFLSTLLLDMEKHHTKNAAPFFFTKRTSFASTNNEGALIGGICGEGLLPISRSLLQDVQAFGAASLERFPMVRIHDFLKANLKEQTRDLFISGDSLDSGVSVSNHHGNAPWMFSADDDNQQAKNSLEAVMHLYSSKVAAGVLSYEKLAYEFLSYPFYVNPMLSPYSRVKVEGQIQGTPSIAEEVVELEPSLSATFSSTSNGVLPTLGVDRSDYDDITSRIHPFLVMNEVPPVSGMLEVLREVPKSNWDIRESLIRFSFLQDRVTGGSYPTSVNPRSLRAIIKSTMPLGSVPSAESPLSPKGVICIASKNPVSALSRMIDYAYQGMIPLRDTEDTYGSSENGFTIPTTAGTERLYHSLREMDSSSGENYRVSYTSEVPSLERNVLSRVITLLQGCVSKYPMTNCNLELTLYTKENEKTVEYFLDIRVIGDTVFGISPSLIPYEKQEKFLQLFERMDKEGTYYGEGKENLSVNGRVEYAGLYPVVRGEDIVSKFRFKIFEEDKALWKSRHDVPNTYRRGLMPRDLFLDKLYPKQLFKEFSDHLESELRPQLIESASNFYDSVGSFIVGMSGSDTLVEESRPSFMAMVNSQITKHMPDFMYDTVDQAYTDHEENLLSVCRDIMEYQERYRDLCYNPNRVKPMIDFKTQAPRGIESSLKMTSSRFINYDTETKQFRYYFLKSRERAGCFFITKLPPVLGDGVVVISGNAYVVSQEDMVRARVLKSRKVTFEQAYEVLTGERLPSTRSSDSSDGGIPAVSVENELGFSENPRDDEFSEADLYSEEQIFALYGEEDS